MKTKLIPKFVVTVAAILSLAAFADAQTCPGSPGCLDPTFGTGGMVITTPPLATNQVFSSTQDMVFQADGKILMLTGANDRADNKRTERGGHRIRPRRLDLDPTGGFTKR